LTWFIDVITIAPLAVITAPEKRCGKTQLLSVLCAALCSDAEKPWATYSYDRPLSTHKMSRLLGGFGIRSKQMRIDGETGSGVELAQFEDAFARYLGPQDGDGPTAKDGSQEGDGAPSMDAVGDAFGLM
jgi:Protein of unknown function (DUF3631)